MTTYSQDHQTFVIQRTYPAPVDRVYRAWSDPALKARWFAGSTDALGAGYELDLQVGGHEVNTGGPPGGPVYTYDAQYHDIVPARRLVYSYVMHADGTLLSVTVVTVEFRDVSGSTELLVTEQGVFLDGHDTVAQREAGTRSMLDSLAALLGEDL